MIARTCRYPGCFSVVPTGTRWCTKHAREGAARDAARVPYGIARSNAGLYNTQRWKMLRIDHLSRNPACVGCGSEERLTVDHVIPPRGNEELFFDESNLQTLCFDCHSRKTTQEITARRGTA